MIVNFILTVRTISSKFLNTEHGQSGYEGPLVIVPT